MLENLKTDYQDYIPPSTGKKYVIAKDAQGYSTIQDATEYTQEGDTFGASDINATNTTVNRITNSVPYSLAVGEEISSNTNLNDYVTPGTYSVKNSSIASTLSNTPVTDSGFKLMVQYNQGTANGSQYVFQNEKAYSRSMAGNPVSSFGAWKIMLAADSPSYGSNTNGSWQKLPGGIMIAWGTKNTDTIQSNDWVSAVFNFPLAFSSPPLVIAAQRYDSRVKDITLNVGGSSTDGAWCHVFYGGTNPNSVTVNWIAVGSY